MELASAAAEARCVTIDRTEASNRRVFLKSKISMLSAPADLLRSTAAV
jgi:hypothetical protein